MVFSTVMIISFYHIFVYFEQHIFLLEICQYFFYQYRKKIIFKEWNRICGGCNIFRTERNIFCRERNIFCRERIYSFRVRLGNHRIYSNHL